VSIRGLPVLSTAGAHPGRGHHAALAPAFDNDAGNTWLRQIVIDLLQQYGRSS
jgi:hypothetical protein